MADDRIFTLVGKFDDKITPSLAKLSKSITGLTRDFDKLKRNLRPIAKDMAIMAEGANRISDGFKNQRGSIDTAVRGLTEYRRELGKAASAQQKLSKKVSLPTISGGGVGGGSSRPSRGRGGGGGDVGGDHGDGYTIAKGMIANLATNMITGIFDQIGNAVGKSINFVKNAVQERIDDEMGDIQSAGGILSVGKEKKVPWADTYEEAFAIQKRLNGEMANLAAALPGETGQYVNNMKQVTDTVMKVTTSNGPAMIKAMQGFNGSVKTSQDAYVEATKQLAKYTTLASLGQTGGVPLTALAEQMLNSDKVNVKSLKRTFAALEKNPLVSGAFEKYEAEMNKAGAGSAERYTAMLKAFEQAFPAEILDAMTNSADGIIQGLKSGLLNPDTGLLGLGRNIKVSFAGLNRKMGPAMEELSVFDMFLKIFKAFGMVLGPIITELPKILEVMNPIINPLKDFFVKAENTISNLKGATKMFGDLKLEFPAFRGALMAIGKLAKSMGGDKAQFETLQKMLMGKKLNLGAALQQAFKVLFSSDALKKFGEAAGEALGGFLSMLSGLVSKGDEMMSESGLVGGFLKGWKKAKGTQAIVTLVRKIVGAIVKTVVGAITSIVKTDPIGSAALAVVFFEPIRNKLFDLMKFLGGKVASSLAPKALGAIGMGGQAAAATGAVGATGGGMGATIAGWLGAVGPALSLIARLLPPVAAVLAGIVLLGGGVDNSMRQLSQIGGEVGNSLGGSFEALGGVLGTTVAMIGDLGNGIGRLFNWVGSLLGAGEGVSLQLDMLKIALFPITGLFQALEMGIRGIDLALKTLRMWLANWLGTDEERKNAQKERQEANIKTRESAGRQNAYNMSMQGPAALSKAMNNAIFELNKSKTLKADRSAELKAFVAEAKAQLATKKPTTTPIPGAKPTAGGLPTVMPPVPAASLEPLKAAVAAGTTATQGVKTAVAAGTTASQGVKTAVTAGTAATVKASQSAEGTKQAIVQGNSTQSSQMGTLIASTNGVKAAISNIKIPPPAPAAATTAKRSWDGKGANSMPLHSAIASEMANKPAGSDLVIANSSETIIPAAGGLGSMDGMVNAIYGAAQTTAGAFSAGFQTFSQKVTAGQQATVAAINRSTQVSSAQSMAMLTKLSAQNAALMSKISASPAFMGGGGGMALGGGYGSRGSQIAGALGTYIKQTGGAPGSIHEHPQHGGVKYKHSPNSYHYKGRAIDIGAYANEQGGVLRRVAQFNAQMGVKPVELLKAGDPGHSDHVHVAYAMGSGNPAFFSNAGAADKWESMMAGKNPIVSSVRAQANEMRGGGTMTVNAPITINAQPGQDTDQLASLVAIKLTQAVNQLRYSSYNV